jgi:hypothetical protein
MSTRNRAFLRNVKAGWKPRVNDVVYLPDVKPYRRSARGRVCYVLAPLVTVRYLAHNAIREAIFKPEELRPCRGRCRVPEFVKG